MNSYVIHAMIPGTGNVYRRVEILGRQTLHDLHSAIQLAFGFDQAHFYSFFMSNQAWDKFNEYAIPEGFDPYGNPLYSIEMNTGPKGANSTRPTVDWDDPEAVLAYHYHNDAEQIAAFKASRGDRWQLATRWLAAQHQTPGDVLTTTIDSLCLQVKKQFLYLFDYGYEWRFQLRVISINAEPDLSYSFPRTVAAEGVAPAQYPEWEQGRHLFQHR